MRWSLGFGAGPVRATVPLQGRRRSGRRVHPLAWLLAVMLLMIGICCCLGVIGANYGAHG